MTGAPLPLCWLERDGPADRGAEGVHNGWRWVFLVNLFIGAVALPMAARILPRARSRVRRQFDPVWLCLLSAGLLLLLIPLVEGEQLGWPAWCYVCFGGCVVTFALLAGWEVRAERRGKDPAPAIERGTLTVGWVIGRLGKAGWKADTSRRPGEASVRSAPAPDSHVVGQRPGMVSARHRRARARSARRWPGCRRTISLVTRHVSTWREVG